jgi:hypothetical protein
MRAIIVCAIAIALGACGDDQEPPTAPAPTTTVAAAPAAPAAPTADQVPVPEDYAQRAQTEVTEQNYRAQLDTVEGEIAER